ncbi:hypothetical protein CFBP3846_P500030 (plasmid) [Pseudomonas syringae pv. avii]|uniref:Uncharacterized protein n=1 Tax=Pseudomonas syringae pv. avii TaxID=663959 RepID=A0ABY1UHP6_PSESX|nr:hypothetical protein CFBP3846_P500030 [Pseudomonas syringae pv. avii]
MMGAGSTTNITHGLHLSLKIERFFNFSCYAQQVLKHLSHLDVINLQQRGTRM